MCQVLRCSDKGQQPYCQSCLNKIKKLRHVLVVCFNCGELIGFFPSAEGKSGGTAAVKGCRKCIGKEYEEEYLNTRREDGTVCNM